MAIILNENERLVYAGTVALRAPNGKPLPAVPYYIIVPADKADPAAVTEVEEGKCLVYGGRLYNDRKRAEERFAALKAGREQPPREIGTPLYLMEDVANINPKTGRTYESDKAIDGLSEILFDEFVRQERKAKAIERQGKNKP